MENYNIESARELINSAEKELSKEFEKAEEMKRILEVLQVMVMEILEEKK